MALMCLLSVDVCCKSRPYVDMHACMDATHATDVLPCPPMLSSASRDHALPPRFHLWFCPIQHLPTSPVFTLLGARGSQYIGV